MSRFEDWAKPAIEFATHAHAGQTRDTPDGAVPYVLHPIAVGRSLFEDGFNLPIVFAGILHDVIEDTLMDRDHIAKVFGEEVADMVQEVTDVFTHEAFPHNNRAWRKTAEANRLATVSDGAKAIKRADIADNDKWIEAKEGEDPGFAAMWRREKAHMLKMMEFEKYPVG